MMLRLASILCALSALPVAGSAQGVRPPYRDSTSSVEMRVADLLSRMTPTEKFWQLFMLPGSLDNPAHDYSHGVYGLQVVPTDSTPDAAARDASRLNRIQHHFVDSTRLGIPFIAFEEALHGLTRPGATTFPQAIALAATWDTALVERVATAIARETSSRGIRQVLSPVVNITRDGRWGRTEETYGEDVLLASAMARSFITPFERAGVITTPKHFVANVGEGGRDSWPIEVSERQLREVWFPPFEAAVRAGARSVMTAYNSVDGLPASQNRVLLTGVLRDRWGFDGVVISDAAATAGATVLHLTEASIVTSAAGALDAGLDVVFQSGWEQHTPWLRAFTDGTVPDSLINRAVTRVLRTKFAMRLFDAPYAMPDSAAYWNGRPEHLALAREAAASGMVLLRNENSTLPLDHFNGTLAVIGPDARMLRLGGYSGPGVAPVTVLEALQRRLGAARVRATDGPGRTDNTWPTVPATALSTVVDGQQHAGLQGEYHPGQSLADVPFASPVDATVDFHWTFNPPVPGVPRDWFAVRWSGTLRIPKGSPRLLAVEGDDGVRLWIDDHLVIDQWEQVGYGLHQSGIVLEPGSEHAIRLEFHESVGNGSVRLAWQGDEPAQIERVLQMAVDTAARSDAVLVVAGLEEGEFRDRASLALPGHQEELIRRLAATGRPVIVVIIGGAPVIMDRWIDSVAAVVMAWYPGEGGGEAIADVLLGESEPGGRLPITFPRAEGQLPLYYSHKPTGRGDDYLDLTGRPAFPFGFGMGYATFEYERMELSRDTIGVSDSVRVVVTIRNTSARAGTEVVQLYLHDLLSTVSQPVSKLAGFRKIRLAPGARGTVDFSLGPDELSILDEQLARIVEPGEFRIGVGPSSRDARLRAILTVVRR